MSKGGIGRASALLASGTLVSRALGFIKSIVLVAAIGQFTIAGNAFALATQLPNNIYALVAGGLLSAILVPQIVRARLHDDGGQAYINKIVTLGATSFVVIAALATGAAPLLVSLYARSGEGQAFTADGIALAVAFAAWCLPQILFYALYSLLGQVLNAHGSFGAFTWAPVVNNIVALSGLGIFIAVYGDSTVNGSTGVWDAPRIALLAGTATLGVASQALILGAFWKRAGLTFRLDFGWRGVGLRRTGTAAGWTFGMILVTQVAGVFQSNTASLAANGGASLSVLQNSWLIFMLPHSVIAVSIATAYFTRMSTHASTGDLKSVRADVSSSLRQVGVLIVFSSIALMVVAFPFARVFEVPFENVTAMALVIIAYVLGLVPFSAAFVLQRALFSLEDTRAPFFIEVAKSSVFILGALMIAFLLSPGAPEWIGVCLALLTTLTCTLQAVLTFIILRRRIGSIGGGLLLRRHVQYLVAGLFAGAVGVGILVTLGGLTPGGFAQSGRIPAILSMIAIGTGMLVVYFGVLLAMKNPEASSALERVTSRFPRRNR